MQRIGRGGGARSVNIKTLNQSMGPVLQRIKESSVFRESNRILPYSEIMALRETGFLLARFGRDSGGYDVSLPDLFELIVSVAEADPNIAQSLRSHFGFIEHVLTSADDKRHERWLHRLTMNDIVAAASTESGSSCQNSFGARLENVGGEWILNGEKAYATGALFADWIEVEVTSTCGKEVAVMVPKSAPGVTVRDDWNGFGQRLSASGTIEFVNVRVTQEDMICGDPFPYYESFYQLYLLAILAGIGRAASNDLSAMIASRKRTYSHSVSEVPCKDPQLQQIVGEVRSSAYAAAAVVLRAAYAMQHVHELSLRGDVRSKDIALADVEVWQAQHAVSQLVLSATTRMFDALGGSATLQKHCLDRHWRNARTIVSHNPVVYKSRIVGDFAVNGENPPGQWRIGVPSPITK